VYFSTQKNTKRCLGGIVRLDGFYEPLLALFFAFGLLFLVVGFCIYYDD